MKRGFAARRGIAEEIVADYSRFRSCVYVCTMTNQELDEFYARIARQRMMQRSLVRFLAAAVRVSTVFKQESRAVNMVHVAKSGQHRGTVFICLSIRVGTFGQEKGGYVRMKVKQSAGAMLVRSVYVGTRFNERTHGVEIAIEGGAVQIMRRGVFQRASLICSGIASRISRP